MSWNLGSASQARATRLKRIEESRARLETELGVPIRRMADTIWEAYAEYARQACRYALKVVLGAVMGIILLSLFFAHEPGRSMYSATYGSLVLALILVTGIVMGLAAYQLSRKFESLQAIMKNRLPNLYRIDEGLAQEVSKDAVTTAIANEYQRQIRHAQEFVQEVRESRLAREHSRTEAERARASGWIEITTTKEAEAEWVRRLLVEGHSSLHGAPSWVVVPIGEDPSRGDFQHPDGLVSDGAHFALFTEVNCCTCGARVRCGEPYQIRHSPVGYAFGPERLSETIPTAGRYRSRWLPKAGCDVFEGGWYCQSCYLETADSTQQS